MPGPFLLTAEGAREVDAVALLDATANLCKSFICFSGVRSRLFAPISREIVDVEKRRFGQRNISGVLRGGRGPNIVLRPAVSTTGCEKYSRTEKP